MPHADPSCPTTLAHPAVHSAPSPLPHPTPHHTTPPSPSPPPPNLSPHSYCRRFPSSPSCSRVWSSYSSIESPTALSRSPLTSSRSTRVRYSAPYSQRENTSTHRQPTHFFLPSQSKTNSRLADSAQSSPSSKLRQQSAGARPSLRFGS